MGFGRGIMLCACEVVSHGVAGSMTRAMQMPKLLLSLKLPSPAIEYVHITVMGLVRIVLLIRRRWSLSVGVCERFPFWVFVNRDKPSRLISCGC